MPNPILVRTCPETKEKGIGAKNFKAHRLIGEPGTSNDGLNNILSDGFRGQHLPHEVKLR